MPANIATAGYVTWEMPQVAPSPGSAMLFLTALVPVNKARLVGRPFPICAERAIFAAGHPHEM